MYHIQHPIDTSFMYTALAFQIAFFIYQNTFLIYSYCKLISLLKNETGEIYVKHHK